MKAKQYPDSSVRTEKDGNTTTWFFCEDILDDFADLFSHCSNHIEVEKDLADAGVLDYGDNCGSGGNLRITFASQSAGRSFLHRLNGYLKRCSDLIS